MNSPFPREQATERFRRTNMEQFASQSDVIKFPANFQITKLKSYLFLASFPQFPYCYGVCKVSDVLRNFFTINLM